MSSGADDSRTFDLKTLNELYFARRRGERIAGLATFGGLAMILIVLFALRWQSAVKAISQVSLLGIAWIVEVAAFAVAISLGVSLFVIASPNLSTIRLSSDELVLEFRGGSSKNLKWSDPKLHFRMQNFDGQLPPGSIPISTRFLSIPRGPTSALTVAAYDSLLASARSHGMTIESYRGVKGVGLVPTIYDIHGSAVHVSMWFRSPVGS